MYVRCISTCGNTNRSGVEIREIEMNRTNYANQYCVSQFLSFIYRLQIQFIETDRRSKTGRCCVEKARASDDGTRSIVVSTTPLYALYID